MTNYDAEVRCAKERVTKTLCSNGGKPDVTELASAIDDLNKAWDRLTDALMRQREKRDELITNLLNRLAEVER